MIIFRYLYCLCAICVLGQTQNKIEWPSLADSPWPTLRGDMQGSGRSDFLGPKNANVIWRADLPLGIFNGPIVGYDNILFFGTHAIDSDLKNQFYAYYPTGNLFWLFETNSGIPNSLCPLISKDSNIYMGSNSVEIYSFTHNGILNWRKLIGDGIGEELSISKTGIVYTYTRDTIKAINKFGNLIFVIPFPKISSQIMFSPDGKTLYFKTEYNFSYLNAIDSIGNIKWRYNLRSNDAPVCVDNQGNIYTFGSDTINVFADYLFSFYPNGEVRWKFELNNFYENVSPTIDHSGNIIFACQYGNPNLPYLVSLNHNGALNWASKIDSTNPYSYPDHGLVCDAEGKIYFGDTFGTYFYCFNKDGSLLWKLPLNDYEYNSSPAIGSDGTLYIGTHKSTFFQNHVQNLIAVKDSPTTVNEIDPSCTDYKLEQNYPNPFNPSTKISFNLAADSKVTLKVFNLLGEEVKTLISGNLTGGSHKVDFNAINLNTGVYIYKIEAAGFDGSSFTNVKKMTLIK